MKALNALFLIAAAALSMPARAVNPSCFDDQRLQELQVNQPRGALIYIWSPRMVYSVQNAEIAARAATASGLDFVALHDIRISGEELIQARLTDHAVAAPRLDPLQRRFELSADTDLATPPFVSPLTDSQALCSEQLIHRDALRHFPTAFVITRSAIAIHPIVGAMPVGGWASSIDQRLQQVAQQP
jgi:hypothetical protein